MTVSTVWQDWSCCVRVTLAGGDGSDLVAASGIVRQLMDEVAHAASRFRDDSDLTRVNDAAGALVPVGRLTLDLVDVALDAARLTGGAVDPTVGAHLLGAGYDDDIDHVRSHTHRVGAPRPSADWQGVTVDHELRRVGVRPGLLLDLGATAKAWTVDEAARRVHARLGHAVLVGIGGDLAVAGATTRPWHVDVSEVMGGPRERVDLTHGGLATSSVLARTWASDRGVQHHVIDPATGSPARGSVRTATVWAPTAVAANTWSTAAIVWGEAAAGRLRDAGIDARLVDTDGRVTTLGTWPSEGIAA
ncbi:FAD:protein FMN transferase [Nocardioides sp. CN2-186]|uniref:FAD:protein FMN transferase n=1 Tax=Nocardioides tweenelious TaxID=3156607 RepID=UPI0032B31599